LLVATVQQLSSIHGGTDFLPKIQKRSALSQFQTCPILQPVKNINLKQDVHVEASFRYFQIKRIYSRLLTWLIYLH